MQRITLYNIDYDEYLDFLDSQVLPDVGMDTQINDKLYIINLTVGNTHFGNDVGWSFVLGIITGVPLSIATNLLSSFLYEKITKLKQNNKKAQVVLDGKDITDKDGSTIETMIKEDITNDEG